METALEPSERSILSCTDDSNFNIKALPATGGSLGKDPHTASLHVVSSNLSFPVPRLTVCSLFDHAHPMRQSFSGVRMEG